METMTVKYGNEYMAMDIKTGNISRPEIKMGPSGKWRVVGAVLYNNFGNIIARCSLQDIVNGKIKDWQYKNRKQKWHVMDYDHGTHRIWGSPNHSIFY